MNENENITPSYKPQFVLTITSHEQLSDNIQSQIDKAIGKRVNLTTANSFDNITHTYRYIYKFSPSELESCKERINNLAKCNKSNLTLFFDPAESVGLRKLLNQM